MKLNDTLSPICPLDVCIFKNNEQKTKQTLFCATGFIYKKNKNLYFVTGLNVVTGRDISTGIFKTKGNYLPDVISVFVPSIQQKKQNKPTLPSFELQLYDTDNNPIWLIHPLYKRSVDIAVIPLAQYVSDLNPINDISDESVVFSDTFKIIGYPLFATNTDDKTKPLWIDVSLYKNDKQTFYIENTPRLGMFGAPVFAYEECLDSIFIKFLGIFSGKSSNENDSPLPVWKKELLDEIIQKGIKDSSYL